MNPSCLHNDSIFRFLIGLLHLYFVKSLDRAPREVSKEVTGGNRTLPNLSMSFNRGGLSIVSRKQHTATRSDRVICHISAE